MSSDHTMEDWELLAQVSQAYRTLSDDFMEQIGMHRAQATLLCRLYSNEGMTQSEIAGRLSVQGATVTSILQRLEEAALIMRRRDPADNRLVRVYLTDAGRQKERAITEQFLQLEDAMFAGISEEERSLARRLLQQILRNMAART